VKGVGEVGVDGVDGIDGMGVERRDNGAGISFSFLFPLHLQCIYAGTHCLIVSMFCEKCSSQSVTPSTKCFPQVCVLPAVCIFYL
jgi:hypothetical protein